MTATEQRDRFIASARQRVDRLEGLDKQPRRDLLLVADFGPDTVSLERAQPSR